MFAALHAISRVKWLVLDHYRGQGWHSSKFSIMGRELRSKILELLTSAIPFIFNSMILSHVYHSPFPLDSSMPTSEMVSRDDTVFVLSNFTLPHATKVNTKTIESSPRARKVKRCHLKDSRLLTA